MTSPGDLPSITVITPCLDAAATLEQTLRSVRTQDYPRLEHVAVDGGSRDGTVEILERASGVRYVSEPDRGLAHAMNKGIAMAQGDIVAELNADDVYRPGALLAVGRAFAEHPDAEWLTGRCSIIGADGREVRRPITAYKSALLRRYSLRSYFTQNFVSAPATFFRRSALVEVGGFDERYRISIDYDLHLRLARRGDPIVLDRQLACFRVAEGTLGMSGYRQQFREHAEQARRHADGHRFAAAANQVISRAIVATYGVMALGRALRRHRGGKAPRSPEPQAPRAAPLAAFDDPAPRETLAGSALSARARAGTPPPSARRSAPT